MHTRLRRIVTLTHEFFPTRGGIATYLEEVARESVLAGRLIEVWAPARSELDNREFSFPVKTLPLKGSQDWSCRIRLAVHLLKRQQELCESLCYLPEPGPIVTWMYLQLLQAPFHSTTVNCSRSRPRAPHQAALWFERPDKTITVVRVNISVGGFAGDALIIPRR